MRATGRCQVTLGQKLDISKRKSAIELGKFDDQKAFKLRSIENDS